MKKKVINRRAYRFINQPYYPTYYFDISQRGYQKI